MKQEKEPRDYLDDLPRGKAAAVKSCELQRIWNKDRRQVSAIIEDLRRSGEMICSCGNGYFLPETLQEVSDFYWNMYSRSMSILYTLKDTGKYLKDHGIDPRRKKRA